LIKLFDCHCAAMNRPALVQLPNCHYEPVKICLVARQLQNL
jgi:hypothetical protein